MNVVSKYSLNNWNIRRREEERQCFAFKNTVMGQIQMVSTNLNKILKAIREYEKIYGKYSTDTKTTQE